MSLPEPDFLKKSYFPGLISIVILPIACIVYMYFYQVKYMMPVSWFDKNGIERLKTHYDKKIDFEKFRLYKNLYLNGNVHGKSEIKKLTNELIINKDFKNGICVIITNKTQYQDIVTTLDIAMNQKGLGIIPYYNKIYIFNDNRLIKEKGAMMPCGGVLMLPIDREHNGWIQDFYDSFKTSFNEFPTGVIQFWPCLVPFIGMIFFWRKRNKTYWNIN